MEELEAHLTSAGLGRFASKIIEVTHAETCADLALLDEAMVEAIIPQCGLQFVSAAKFKQCVASVALPPPLSPLGGGGGGGDGGGVDLPSARRASSYLSMEDELHELTAASAHVMSWMCSSECTLESLVDVVVDSVYKLVGCECCTLYFVDRVKAELWIAVARDKEIEGFRMPVGTGIAGKVAATCTSFNTSECKADAQWNSELDERTGFRTETMLCVPVFVPGGEAVAVLQVMNRTRPAVSSRLSSRLTIESKVAALAATAPYSFDQHDEHVLSNFGLLVALAVQKCSAELVLRKLSKDDRRGRDASTASDTSTMTAEAERLLMSEFFSHGMRDQVGRMLDDARTGSEEAPSSSSSSSSSVTPVAPPRLRRWPSLVEDEEDDEADGSTRADLRRWDIDIHALEDATLLRYVEIMLTEWIPPENSVPAATMRSFIMAAVAGYKNNPFHNKFHGVSVCQITYMILRSEANLASVLSPIECFAMIVAALCHDLGHPGVNNAYLVAANDPIAQRHADERDAVLERFHIANTFEILSDERCNLLATFPRKDIVVFRRTVIKAILATDMSRHHDLVVALHEVERPLGADATTKDALIGGIVHCADLAGQAMAWDLAQTWGDGVRAEFIAQAAAEAAGGLPVSGYMVGLAEDKKHWGGQLFFVSNIVVPLWSALSSLIPNVAHMEAQCMANRERYEALIAGASS